MRVMITTNGGTMDVHYKIVDIVNSLYDLTEEGANGGYGNYFTHGEHDYKHITRPISDTWKIKDVTIWVETVDEDDD